MQNVIKATGPETAGFARLVGGPADLPEGSRTHPGGAPDSRGNKIKVAHLGGYEHFERAAESADTAHDNAAEVQFNWTMRTEAAE